MTGGRLTVRETVVEKVAAESARSLPAVSAVGGALLPRMTGSPKRPKVEVTLSGSVASLRVHLALPFPAPIRDITEHVREHLRHEVHRLTGVTVHYVDITVGGLEVGEGEGAHQEGGRRWARLH